LRERETDSHIDIHKENPQMVEALIILGRIAYTCCGMVCLSWLDPAQ
jgi:hypothetical protein